MIFIIRATSIPKSALLPLLMATYFALPHCFDWLLCRCRGWLQPFVHNESRRELISRHCVSRRGNLPNISASALSVATLEVNATGWALTDIREVGHFERLCR